MKSFLQFYEQIKREQFQDGVGDVRPNAMGFQGEPNNNPSGPAPDPGNPDEKPLGQLSPPEGNLDSDQVLRGINNAFGRFVKEVEKIVQDVGPNSPPNLQEINQAMEALKNVIEQRPVGDDQPPAQAPPGQPNAQAQLQSPAGM